MPKQPDRTPALTDAERQLRRRQRGKPVSTVLTDRGAIAVLERLNASGYSQARALELGLLALARPAPPAQSSRKAR